MANILGLNFSHDGAVALVVDGRLHSALATERITRKKKAHGITKQLVESLLNNAGLAVQDIKAIALADYIQQYCGDVLHLFDGIGLPVRETSYTLYNNDVRQLTGKFMGNWEVPVYVLPHHLAHASSSFYTSNFESAVCLSVDSSFGNLQDNSLILEGNDVQLLTVDCPNLISGIGYATFTELLGYQPAFAKAGITMGLSSYGAEMLSLEKDYFLSKMFWPNNDTGVQIELEYRKFWSDVWQKFSAKHPHELTFQESANLAATIQYLLEKSLIKTAENIRTRYPYKNLCLSGGSFLNCISNTAIKNLGLFDNIHHFPACGDDGNAVGAALWVAHTLYQAPRQQYSTADLAYLGLNQISITDPDYSRVCDILSQGGIVAWHMGRSEYGPRALGARSLLADPRKYHMREKINFAVKNREWFRPIAPVVLEHLCHEWFDLEGPSPYMLYTANVLQPEKIPAVTHVDNSSRPQTVSQLSNPYLWKLLNEWNNQTGVPVLVNTSLNGGGEPLCETEQDSLKFFQKHDSVTALVLNGKLLERK
jgi:carbamoyltransferase